MEYIFYIIAIFLIGYSGYSIYNIVKKNNGFTEEGWKEVSKIGSETIDELIKLYNSRKDKTKFISDVINIIMIKVYKLPDDIKEFFTKDRIEIIFKPVIEKLIDKLDKK